MKTKLELLDDVFDTVIGKDPTYRVKQRSEIPHWDSLRLAQLIIAIEKKIGHRLTVAELVSIDSFTSLKLVILKDSE